jgi:hypothetical protein
MIEYSVVQIKNSPFQALVNKFGRSKVVATQDGLGVVVDPISVPVNKIPEGTQSTSIIPASEGAQTPSILDTRPKSKYAIDTSLSTALNYQKGKISQAIDAAKESAQASSFTPALMQAPLKGMDEQPVTREQLQQIKNVQDSTSLPDEAIDAIARTITGKDNLNLLTQKEAYDVSETIRMHGKVDDPAAWHNISYGAQSLFVRARDRFANAQQQFGVPVHDEMYVPITTGLRLSRNLRTQLQTDARTAMQVKDESGKMTVDYSQPKYQQERRLLMSYVQGDTKVVTDNPNLDPKAKADLVKIGDWFHQKFLDFFQSEGISSEKYLSIYAPQLKKLGTVFQLYKTDELPAEYSAFYEHQRDPGTLSPIEDDLLAAYDIYAGAIAKSKFLKKPLEDSLKLLKKTKDIRALYKDGNDWLQETLGFQDSTAEFLNEMGKRLSQKTGGFVPVDITKQMIDLAMTNSYVGALGLPRLDAPIRNMVQQFMNYAEFGPEVFGKALRYANDQAAIEEMKKKGFLVDMGVPYGEDLAQQASRSGNPMLPSGIQLPKKGNMSISSTRGGGISATKNIKMFIGKTVETYKNASQWMLKPYSASESSNRVVAFKATEMVFKDAWKKLDEGKITYPQFEQMVNMDGYSVPMQGLLREKINTGTPQSLNEALDLMQKERIDRTQFPYRKGEEGRVFYGLRGKLGLQFGQWTSEYFQTLWTSWASRGQWVKLVRLYASGELLKRSVENALGIDISKWVNQGPLQNGFPVGPLTKSAVSAIQMATSISMKDQTGVNTHWKEITQALKLYGGAPFGVGVGKFEKLYQSVNRFEKGIVQSPDPSKPFGVWSSAGKLVRWVSFSDLLLNSLGFTDIENQAFSDRINSVTKSEQTYSNHIDQAMNYLIDGNSAKFDETVQKYGLLIPDIATKMRTYQVPLDQRIYDRLPMPLKMRYAPLFYPQQ